MKFFYSTALLLSGLLTVAHAQTLTVSPQQLTFSVQPGTGVSAAQPVTVTPANASNNTVVFSVNTSTSPWLLVQGTTSGIIDASPAGTTLSVSVNTQNLLAGQTYNGSFTVQLATTPSTQTTVNVTVASGSSGGYSSTPASLAFTAVQGASIGSPGSQNVTINSTNGTSTFLLTAQTQNGGNWLSLNSTGGTTGTPSATFSVSAVPTGLPTGTYTGTITATSSPSGSVTQIPVTLTVSASAQLSVTPTTLSPFLYQTGGAVPPAQVLRISSNSGTIPFTVNVSPAVSWLVISPLSGSASAGSPSTITLTPTTVGLPAGTYTTSLTITPFNGTPLPAIPVTLVVSNNPVLQTSVSSLTFTSPFAGANPADQTVTVTASGGQVGFTATTDMPWLSVVSSTTVTPAQLTVRANTTGLGVGTITANVLLRPTNGDNYTITLPVTLMITNPVAIMAAPSSLLFSFQTNQPAPTSQSVQILSTGAPLAVTATTSTTTCGANWLTATASQTTTPVTLNVSVNTTGMAAGICTGTVSVSYTGSTTPLQIPVVVAVSATAELRVSVPAGFGVETAQQTGAGAGVNTRVISLTSTDPTVQVPYTASATTNAGGTWLTVGPGSGTTPGNLVVTLLPGGLAPGTYGGQITITSPSLPAAITNQAFVIPITLTITPSTQVTVTPTSLAFTQAQGGTPPATQTLTLNSSGGSASFTASVNQITGGDWLEVLPSSGAANQTLTVRVKPNSLPANVTPYSAQIVLAFQNSATAPITIPVSLAVVGSQTLVTVSPQTLVFTVPVGGSAPVAQKLTITSPSPVSFTATTTSVPAGWLTLDATSGTTPKDLNVSINPQGLAIGVYTGSIAILPTGSVVPQTVNVTLTVTTATPPQPLTITNTASNLPGSISPGELITIKGSSLGPVNTTNGGLFTVNASGSVDPRLQGVRVLFDNIPGTPIYVSPTQINVVAPWEIAGRPTTNVVVEYNGIVSSAIAVRVDNITPAFFSLNSTGAGQAAAINQDGTVNGPLNSTNPSLRPAAQGSVVALYVTGGGVTSPGGATGTVSPTNQLLRILGTSSATIAGQPAAVEFIGAAPGLVSGINQVNLRIPPGVTGNAVPVSLTINGVSTPVGLTIAVQ